MINLCQVFFLTWEGGYLAFVVEMYLDGCHFVAQLQKQVSGGWRWEYQESLKSLQLVLNSLHILLYSSDIGSTFFDNTNKQDVSKNATWFGKALAMNFPSLLIKEFEEFFSKSKNCLLGRKKRKGMCFSVFSILMSDKRHRYANGFLTPKGAWPWSSAHPRHNSQRPLVYRCAKIVMNTASIGHVKWVSNKCTPSIKEIERISCLQA